MLPIVDLPFLAHQLAHLRRHGVTDVTFACGFLPQQIIERFGDGADVGLALHYVIEPEPLDTGGAVGFAARTIGEQRLLVCNGDVLTGLDLGELLAFHEAAGAVATIALTPVDDPSRYGLVRTEADGRVLNFLEKPRPEEIDTNMINAGTYVLEPAVIAAIPREGRCNIEREIFPTLVDKGLFARASDDYWKDIGTFPSYLAANIDMLNGRVVGAGSLSGGNTAAATMIESSASVSTDASVHAPCFIGAGVRVAAGAVIGPDAVLCAGARVEAGGRVARSVVLERAVIGRDAQVIDSIVGENATIEARCSVSDGSVIAPGGQVVQPVTRGVAR